MTKSRINPDLKCQSSRKPCHLIFIAWISFVICALTFAINPAYAKGKELVILYTGETHATLYPCNCPVEPDGGLSRRATLIKQLRKRYPGALVLDSGNFFSSGPLDQNTQNTQLDMSRVKINLAAMESMKYDAVNISDDEFNFGEDFFKGSVRSAGLDFISANLASDKLKPYVIREVEGAKIGIIGITNLAAKQKAQGLKISEPKQAVEASVKELKKQEVGLIILLSNLGEEEDLKIIGSVPGISVLIDGHGRGNTAKGSFAKAGNTVILRPSWQGRRLGKAILDIKGGRVEKASVEELRLSDKISDDPDILSLLPRCFTDSDCKKKGLIGSCQNPGSITSGCLFGEAAKVNLTVISARDCSVCNTEQIVDLLKKTFPGLKVVYLYYPDNKAAKLVRDLKITGLPAYLLGKEAARDKGFDNIGSGLEEKADFYMLRPESSGISYFVGRQRLKGKLDLFISPFTQESLGILNAIKEFNPVVHFPAIVNGDKISVALGNPEAEEDLRSVCVQKYYPELFWDYLTCRAKNIGSTWWEDCAVKMDPAKIKACARGPEGPGLLKENASLARELKIMYGPAYLLENNQIFSSKGAPSKEELRKIIKK